MKDIRDVLEELRVDAERALHEYPNKPPLAPVVSSEVAWREFWVFCDSIEGKPATEDVLFLVGQHMARITMCSVLEVISHFPVTPELRVQAFLNYYESQQIRSAKLRDELGGKHD